MEQRLLDQDWVEAGLRALEEEGPAGLRIMKIARTLGVTKGSFYWHFSNQDAFELVLVEQWEQRHTLQIIADVEAAGGNAADKLRSLLTAAFSLNGRLVNAMRFWSISSERVRAAMGRVDAARLAYVAQLLRAMGWPEEDAASLSHWAYSAVLGHYVLGGPVITPGQIDLFLATLIRNPA